MHSVSFHSSWDSQSWTPRVQWLPGILVYYCTRSSSSLTAVPLGSWSSGGIHCWELSLEAIPSTFQRFLFTQFPVLIHFMWEWVKAAFIICGWRNFRIQRGLHPENRKSVRQIWMSWMLGPNQRLFLPLLSFSKENAYPLFISFPPNIGTLVMKRWIHIFVCVCVCMHTHTHIWI